MLKTNDFLLWRYGVTDEVLNGWALIALLFLLIAATYFSRRHLRNRKIAKLRNNGAWGLAYTLLQIDRYLESAQRDGDGMTSAFETFAEIAAEGGHEVNGSVCGKWLRASTRQSNITLTTESEEAREAMMEALSMVGKEFSDVFSQPGTVTVEHLHPRTAC